MKSYEKGDKIFPYPNYPQNEAGKRIATLLDRIFFKNKIYSG